MANLRSVKSDPAEYPINTFDDDGTSSGLVAGVHTNLDYFCFLSMGPLAHGYTLATTSLTCRVSLSLPHAVGVDPATPLGRIVYQDAS